MHYKNGREAKNGDPVIFLSHDISHDNTTVVVAGTLHSIIAGSLTCNGQVAVPVPGGTAQNYVTISTGYHAEDGMALLEEQQPKAVEPAPMKTPKTPPAAE